MNFSNCININTAGGQLRHALALLVLVCAPIPIEAQALPPHSPWPGGIAVVVVGSTTSGTPAPAVSAGGRNILVLPYNKQWVAVLGLPLHALKGQFFIRVDGKLRSLDVQPAQYGQSHITITDPAYTSPPNEQRQKRIAAERQALRKLRAQWRLLPTQTVPDLNAVLPAQGIASTPFGFRRYINGKLRSSHLGLDIAAPVGTAIHAAMAGQVQMIADRFYTGWTVVIDHGLGVQTLYAHLSQVQPELIEGQYIEQGALIGAMGATGRATGSHLHWGLNLSGVAVDPAILLSPEERARIQLPSD